MSLPLPQSTETSFTPKCNTLSTQHTLGGKESEIYCTHQILTVERKIPPMRPLVRVGFKSYAKGAEWKKQETNKHFKL